MDQKTVFPEKWMIYAEIKFKSLLQEAGRWIREGIAAW